MSMSGASPGNARKHYSQMPLEELLESSPDAIVVTDLEGRITGANAQLEKCFCYHIYELFCQHDVAFIHFIFRYAHPAESYIFK